MFKKFVAWVCAHYISFLTWEFRRRCGYAGLVTAYIIPGGRVPDMQLDELARRDYENEYKFVRRREVRKTNYFTLVLVEYFHPADN